MIRRSVYGVCVCLLAACASGPFDEQSRFSSIPVGSELVLNQVIDIAPDQVAVHMQNGKLMEYSAMNHYQPHCKFEIYTMAETPRQVQPDSFLITRVVDNMEMTSLRPSTMAGLMTALDGPDIVTYATYLYLSSAKQPDVFRMSCMHWEDISVRRYLSISEMRRAMGERFSLQIKQPAAQT
ncbi:MAG: hypothetical protein WBN96_04280 [Gammaproteobacteria bacterium]